MTEITRRDFVAVAGATVAMACAKAAHVNTTPAPVSPPHGTTILFQGDSITDMGRNRGNLDLNSVPPQLVEQINLGFGYPLLLSAALGKTHPERDLKIVNRGIGGNKIPDLAARWDKDTIAIAPDILSVLVGVNDYWWTRPDFSAEGAAYHGTAQDYESGYTALLQQTRARLPNTRFVVLEPFVLHTGHVDDSWFPEFDVRRAAAERVAKNVGATYVRLQQAFTDAAARTGPKYWLIDGVHPTLAGHELIADRWREAVNL